MNATVRVNFRRGVWLLDLDALNVETAKIKGDMPEDGAFLIARFLSQGGIHAVPSSDELSRSLYIFHHKQVRVDNLVVEIKKNLGLEVEIEGTEGVEAGLNMSEMVQPMLSLLQYSILDRSPRWFLFLAGEEDPQDYNLACIDSEDPTRLKCVSMSATSELKTERAQQDNAHATSMTDMEEETVYLEVKLQISTYNIEAFSTAESHFFDLVLGKTWFSPYASGGNNGVRLVVIDTQDGMEDEGDFLTPLELRLRERSYLTFLPSTVGTCAMYHRLRSGIDVLGDFRGGDIKNLHLAQVFEKGPDDNVGLASRVPTCLLSSRQPVKSFFRSRYDAPSSLDSFLEEIMQCPEVLGVQDGTLTRSTLHLGSVFGPAVGGGSSQPCGGNPSPLQRASSLRGNDVEEKQMDSPGGMNEDSMDM